MGFTVVGNDAAVVMTSSPGRSGAFSLCEPSALTAQRFAEDPEFTSNEYFVPAAAARSRSNAAVSGPAVSQKSSPLRTSARSSASSNTRPA